MWRILLLLGMANFSLIVAAPQILTQQNTQTILGTQNNQYRRRTNCECIPYYLCSKGKILTDGFGVIEPRLGFSRDTNMQQTLTSSDGCDHYMDVCCEPPNRKDFNDRITPRSVERKGCGQRHPEGVGFRVLGTSNNEAQFGEFPWMVAILKKDGETFVYQCGGSLIHKQVVLTAAHCVKGKGPSELRIRAGEWDTQTKNEIYPHQERNVNNVIVHDMYYPGAYHNDFAILILSEPVEIKDNVDVACLPERNDVFDGSKCFASGWGKDVFDQKAQYQVILKKVELPMVPHNKCQDDLRKTRLGRYFILHESFICAGGEVDKDTCNGDGGSPLVCPSKKDPSRYLQAGIVAWGIGCGKYGTPGVYANVASARDWIDEQMAFYNFDNTVYQL
ncbi:phenoloxidase-activating factor 2 [Xylocopa sonorina]|uniref:phenoloxidase-activating factor 2 n=1 Tax=Xylocopa sonorina TaxID=1818115 RepID=UPI00403AC3F3